MRKTLKSILNEYGPIAVVVYLSLFAVVLFGAYFAIRLGWTPADAASQVGAWTAAYIVTKLTQPLRIAGTVLITTFIGKFLEKRRGLSGVP